MSHWSQNAQQSANRSMGTGAPDAPVRDCETREWEPLAEITQLPDWELQIEILPAAPAQSASAAPTAPPSTR